MRWARTAGVNEGGINPPKHLFLEFYRVQVSKPGNMVWVVDILGQGTTANIHGILRLSPGICNIEKDN